MSGESCASCGHEGYAHSPFHEGRCIADKPYNGEFACPCRQFVPAVVAVEGAPE